MSEKPTYTITLSNGSTAVLRHLLNQSGWTKTVVAFVGAAELLARVVPEPPVVDERPHPMTAQNYKVALEEWKKKDEEWNKGSSPAFIVSEKQRDLIKDCLKQAVEKGQAIPSKPAFDLFSAFGLSE